MFSAKEIASVFDLQTEEVETAIRNGGFLAVGTDDDGAPLFTHAAAMHVAELFDVKPIEPTPPVTQTLIPDGIVCKAKLVPDDGGPRCEL
jgi:hypothetical protein